MENRAHLSDYILESVSGKRNHTSRREFPEDNTDKEGIIDWLEYNGFAFAGYASSIIDVFRLMRDARQENFYTLGKYTDNKTTHSIRVCCGNKCYLIRTVKKNEIESGYVFCAVNTYPDNNPEVISYSEAAERITEYAKRMK
jgi:hypothetical protein